jgi:hypothetical protein
MANRKCQIINMLRFGVFKILDTAQKETIVSVIRFSFERSVSVVLYVIRPHYDKRITKRRTLPCEAWPPNNGTMITPILLIFTDKIICHKPCLSEPNSTGCVWNLFSGKKSRKLAFRKYYQGI